MGVSLEVFEHLNHFYNADLEAYFEHFTVSGAPRKRQMTVRKDSVLCKPEDKLCFILSYLKNNTLQETHASNWGMKQPQCNLWIHFLLQRLLVTLESMQLVPADDSQSLAKLLETVQTLYIDGTERSIQRPLHYEEQKRHYSGKKNAYREA
jgi:hypothetical protein